MADIRIAWDREGELKCAYNKDGPILEMSDNKTDEYLLEQARFRLKGKRGSYQKRRAFLDKEDVIMGIYVFEPFTPEVYYCD